MYGTRAQAHFVGTRSRNSHREFRNNAPGTLGTYFNLYIVCRHVVALGT